LEALGHEVIVEGYPSFGTFTTGGFCSSATITANDHKVRILDDPTGAVNAATGNLNRVLHLWNRDPEDTTCGWATRPHSQVSNVDGMMPAVYFKSRLYLHSDTALWAGCPGWLQIWEAKREMVNSPGFFSLELLLVQGPNDDLVWRARNRVCCGSPQPTFQWEVDNTTISLPYDEWITVEIYWQKGTELDGRFVATVQRRGQPRQTLFDVTGATVYPPQPDSTMYQYKLATCTPPRRSRSAWTTRAFPFRLTGTTGSSGTGCSLGEARTIVWTWTWTWTWTPNGQPKRLPRQAIDSMEEMATTNRLCGAERIRGELLELGIRVSKRHSEDHAGLLCSMGFRRNLQVSLPW
jgi:hypothetical protein